jgi:membrane associated rhomboid family serine protease
MIPIKDDLQPKKAAYITWTLLAVNTLVFLFQLGLPEYLLNRLYYLYGIVPSRLLDWQWAYRYGFPDRGLITLLTSLFLHGGWLHFLANNWTLWLFGDDVEERIGHTNFAILYLLSGVIAGLTHVAFSANSAVPAIGASGAVAGVMGAFLLLYPRARIHVLVPILFFIDIWKIPAALYLPLWFLGELSGLMSAALSVAHFYCQNCCQK